MLQTMLHPGISGGWSHFLSKLFWKELHKKSLYNHETAGSQKNALLVSLWNNTCCRTVLLKILHVCLADKMEFNRQKIPDENSKMVEANYGFLQERDLSSSRPFFCPSQPTMLIITLLILFLGFACLVKLKYFLCLFVWIYCPLANIKLGASHPVAKLSKKPVLQRMTLQHKLVQ